MQDTGLKIAVVDDDVQMTAVYSKIIERLGYPSPSIFSNGTSLVRSMAVDRASFDIIIMDYRMSEMNGIEAARIIQRYRKDTRIVIATAYEFVRESATNAGLPFLLKPFSIEEFADCLKSLERNQTVSMP